MLAAIFHENGGPDVVRIEDVPAPEPRPGEVRLRVRAAALNHLDLWVRRGLPIATTMPHIGGSDVAGIVESLGDGVDDAWLGARVVADPSLSCGECHWCVEGDEPLCERFRILGEHSQGGFAEFVTVPARNLYRLPDDVPLEKAAAVPLAFVTAWRGLFGRAGLRPAERVLVTGASGGVATAAIRLAKSRGAIVHAITSRAWIEPVRALGADFVYDRTDGDPFRPLWQDTGKRGVDVILDSVGAATFPSLVRSLARRGRLVVYGGTTGPDAAFDVRQLFWKQLSILGTTMGSRREFTAAMDAVFKGGLEPVIDATWPLSRAADAHRRLEDGEAFGKIVLTTG